MEMDEKDIQNDLNKENLRLRVEKDQVKELLDKALKKLDRKKTLEEKLTADLNELKQEKIKLEEQIRQLIREKADDKENYLKGAEEKIKL
jgi:tRNA(Phe) wybutosine-synthesizing methylase Tyw3